MLNILELLKLPKKPGGVAAQIPAIEDSLQKLRAERADIEQKIAAYDATRSDMFLGAATEEQILELDRQHELLKLRLERAGFAEAELEARLAAAKEQSARETTARAYTAAADTVSAELPKIEAAIAAFAAAANALTTRLSAALPLEMIALEKDTGNGLPVPASAQDLARALIAEGLFAAAPNLFETFKPQLVGGRPACASHALRVHFQSTSNAISPFVPGLEGEEAKFESATAAANRLLIERFRKKASELRGADAQAAAE